MKHKSTEKQYQARVKNIALARKSKTRSARGLVDATLKAWLMTKKRGIQLEMKYGGRKAALKQVEYYKGLKKGGD